MARARGPMGQWKTMSHSGMPSICVWHSRHIEHNRPDSRSSTIRIKSPLQERCIAFFFLEIPTLIFELIRMWKRLEGHVHTNSKGLEASWF